MLKLANASLCAAISTCAISNVISAADARPSTSELDRIRQLIDANDFENAKDTAAKTIEKHAHSARNEDLPVIGDAYTQLGRIYFAQAAAHESKNSMLQARLDYADARWAYLNAMTYLVSDDEQAAAALYEAGRCYLKLKAVEGDAENNAIHAWKAVLRWYPDSKAGALARRALKDAAIEN
jgi:hypothetical protein